MERTRVSSSNIRSVGYDAAMASLEVEFTNGGIYQYFNVPQERYLRLMSAGSKGGYFADYIRDHYRNRKIR